MLDQITPVLLTYNEAMNIGRTLSKLRWARNIVVVDSYSEDNTREILQQFQQVRIFQRTFDCHANQWNYALKETGIDTEWVLALDADYVIVDEVIDELRSLEPGSYIGGYQATFKYCVLGKPPRGSLYPPVTVLFRAAKAYFVQDGHTHRVVLPGEIRMLGAAVLHDDRKTLSHWLHSQERYMELEAESISKKGWGQLSWADRLRKLNVFAPIVVFFYCLIVKQGFLDGRAGLYYAIQRMLAESLLTLYLLKKTWYIERSSISLEVRHFIISIYGFPMLAIPTNDNGRFRSLKVSSEQCR